MKKVFTLIVILVMAVFSLAVPRVYADLLVSSFSTDNVLRYDETTGVFIDEFVSAGSGGLFGPTSLIFTSEPIPEPTTVALLGIGLAVLAGATVRRRIKKVKQ